MLVIGGGEICSWWEEVVGRLSSGCGEEGKYGRSINRTTTKEIGIHESRNSLDEWDE